MRHWVRLVLVSLMVVAVVFGATLILSDVRRDSRPLVLTGEARFPDYSAGHEPGYDAANTVAILVTLTTVAPWFQGERHELLATVEATPGPGVTAVDPTTLRVYLERPSSPRRDIVTGDLVLLESSGPNRWRSMDGPIVLGPDDGVSGTNFFLSFSLSLNVEYANGRSYGYAGWHPDVRILFPGIVPRLAPVGVLLIAAGAVSAIVVSIARRSGRRDPTVIE